MSKQTLAEDTACVSCLAQYKRCMEAGKPLIDGCHDCCYPYEYCESRFKLAKEVI